MCQAIAVTVVSMTGALTPWTLFVLALVLGCLGALEVPTRQAFLPQLINATDELSNAIALNAMAVHLARFAGPLLAGWLIAWRGEQVCFALNAATYIPLLIVLTLLRVGSEPRPRESPQTLRAGVAYAFGSPVIRAVLISVALVSLFGMPYAALLPAFVRETLGADARVLGLLFSASGAGAIVGALLLSSRLHIRGIERLLKIAPLILATSLILLSTCRVSFPAAVILAVIGFSTVIEMTAGNTVLQGVVAEEMRGRVMSFYVMAFMGMVPFGSFLMGNVAARIGIPATFICGGLVCAFVSAWFAWQFRTMSHDKVCSTKSVEAVEIPDKR
jgi:predicted MFS family arabinose efflux permease